MNKVLVPSQVDVAIVPGSLKIDGLELIDLTFNVENLSCYLVLLRDQFLKILP